MKKAVFLFLAAAMPATAAMAQTDAEKCAAFAPVARAAADSAAAALRDAGAILPGDIKERAIQSDPAAVDAARSGTAGALAGAPGSAVTELAVTAVEVMGPLTRYADRAEIAATVLEACATGSRPAG